MEPANQPVPPGIESPKLSRRRYLIWVSLIFCTLSWLLVSTQPDTLAWLMIFPRWTWLIVGVALLPFGPVRSQKKWWLVVGLFWSLYAAFAVDESKPLARSVPASLQKPSNRHQIRVVTLNCGSGSIAAAEEAFHQEPDLILFQESPQRDAIVQLAAQQWGSEADVVWGPDVSIAARGELTLRKKSPRGAWIWATWRREKEEIEVVSLRLAPVPLRFDFWSPDCWRALTQLRERHHSEIAEILQALEGMPDTRCCLIGGDFNSPARDASLKQLRPVLQDAFDAAGIGWGDTIVNDYPVQRIDQVWVNRKLQPLQAKVIRTHYSDHRLVRCELRVQ